MAGARDPLLTEHLRLRPASTADVDGLFAITSDPRSWTHAPEKIHRRRTETRAWLERAAARWDSDGLSYWIARSRSDGAVVGVGGVQRQTSGNWNLYYRLAPSMWGRGLATELGRAAIHAAHRCDESVAVIAWILEQNTASKRVAERLALADQGLGVDPSDGEVRRAYADRPLALVAG